MPGKSMKDKYQPLRLVVCIVILLLTIVCAEICVNKFFSYNYSDLTGEEKTVMHELRRIKNITGSNGRYIFSDLYKPMDEPFILVETFKGTNIAKKIFAFNVDSVDKEWYSKKISMLYDEKELGNIYTLSRFAPGAFKLSFPEECGFVNINGQDIAYFTYSGGIYTDSSYSRDYFLNAYAYNSFKAFEQKDWKESVPKIKSENTKEYYELLSLEYNILDKLVPYSDGDTLDTLLEDFVTIRSYRLEMFPSVQYAQDVELKSGSADFAAMKLSIWTKRSYSVLTNVTQADASFGKVLQACAKKKLRTNILEEEMYSQSGAVLITALERIHMEYKEQIIKKGPDATPYLLMKDYLNRKYPNHKYNSIEELKQKYSVDEESVKKLIK